MDEIDELEAQVAGAARRRRRIVWGIVGVIVLVGLTPCAIVTWNFAASIYTAAEGREAYTQRATPEQIAAVDDATRALEASLEARAAAWRTAMSGAAALVPRPDLGPCPTRLPVRQPASAERGGSFNNLDAFDAVVFPGRHAFPYAITRGAVPSVPPRVTLARERAADLRERIRREGSTDELAEAVAWARRLATEFWTYDVIVFASEWDRPVADATGTTFSPGRFSGVAVLYDYASDRALCAGAISAESSSQAVEYRSQILQEGRTLQSMLDAELDAEIERAIARDLRHRAGPAAEPQVSEGEPSL